MTDVDYLLDKDDNIIETNEVWDQFARENGAPELCAGRIYGQSLFSFISDDITRMFVRVLLNYARTMGGPVERDYRCDGPDTKRYMRMKIIPQAKGGLLLQHTTLRTEPISPAVNFYSRTSGITRLKCSSCNRLQLTDHIWLEPDSAELKPTLAEGASCQLAYTLCQDCQAQVPELGKR